MYVSAYSKYMLEKLLRDLQETWMRSGHLYNEEIKKPSLYFFNSIQTGCRVLVSKFSSTRILSIRCIDGRLGHGLYSLTPLLLQRKYLLQVYSKIKRIIWKL